MTATAVTWEIRYSLNSVEDGPTVAHGHIKDYPSAEEALDRLGERLATAVAAELRSVSDPAPWKLVLGFEIIRHGPPAELLGVAAAAAAGVDPEADAAELVAAAPEPEEGIDLSAEALAMLGLVDRRRSGK